MANSEAQQSAEIARLKKINQALITRIEAGASGQAAYDQFAHSVFLADTVRDRTAALNQAMQQLQQANTSRAQLMAAISHDVMQPVCAAQLLLSNLIEHPSPTAYEQQLPAVANAICDIEYLLQSLLDYARQDIDLAKPNVQPTNVHEVLGSLATESAPLAQKKGLQLRYVTSSCWIMTDVNLLVRILRNLITNAIRYTQSGTILLGVRRRHNKVIIQVIDSGIGMQEDLPGQIFEAFHKLKNHNNVEGLGLGLANVKKLCHLLDHDIGYESQLSRGTCFSVTIDRCAPPVAAKTPTSMAGIVPFTHNVMVIDNSVQVCQALTLLLESWGSQVESYSQVDEITPKSVAWADLLIVDYHLDHGLTGLQLVDSLNITCPLLFISASNEPAVLDAIQAAHHPLLNKPIRPGHLRRVLENLVN
jgi:two-component system, sensor histidine kinase